MTYLSVLSDKGDKSILFSFTENNKVCAFCFLNIWYCKPKRKSDMHEYDYSLVYCYFCNIAAYWFSRNEVCLLHTISV